jgi:hypothetical protein
LVRPVTVHVVAVKDEHERPPGVAVAIYGETAHPPFDTGATHVMTELAFTFDVATTPVGAPGTVTGIAAAEATESADVPDALVAVTLKVYQTPFVRPVTTQVRAPVVVHVRALGLDVTVYPVIADPPSVTGAVQVMVDLVDS